MNRRRWWGWAGAVAVVTAAVVLVVSWLVVRWAEGNGGGGQCPSEANITRVIRVIDGDTFEAEVALSWLQATLLVRERFRLRGVDAWELRDGQRGLAAKRFTERWLLDRVGRLSVQACGRDNFGRALVHVRAGHEDLGDVLVAAGHAERRPGG